MTKVISLTFDDALPEHLDFVAPLLNRYGFQGTFYVHLSSPVLSSRADEWRALAAAGHELGNHTVFHPADARKSWVTTANAIDNYTPERMQAELKLASEWLRYLDGRSQRSFAYPCSNSVLGQPGVFRRIIRDTRLETTRLATWLDAWSGPGDSRHSYQPIAAELFTACRGGGLSLQEQVPQLKQFDRYQLPSASLEDCSAEDVQRFVERGLAAGTWPILQIHGVGGDHGQNCTPQVFEEFLAWLSRSGVSVRTVTDHATAVWSDTE